MARARMIRPEFWTDEKIGSITPMARLLFIGMWTFADDEGIVRSHPSYLRSMIFSYDNFKTEEIEELLGVLESCGLILRYSVNDQHYAWIIKFRVYQRIDKPQPSSNPVPSWKNEKYRSAIFRRDKFVCKYCSRTCLEFIVKQNSYSATDDYDEGLQASIDHIHPQVNGGSNLPSNLTTCCISCNKSKGAHEEPRKRNIRGQFQERSKNDSGIVAYEVEVKLSEKEIEIEPEGKLSSNNGSTTGGSTELTSTADAVALSLARKTNEQDGTGEQTSPLRNGDNRARPRERDLRQAVPLRDKVLKGDDVKEQPLRVLAISQFVTRKFPNATIRQRETLAGRIEKLARTRKHDLTPEEAERFGEIVLAQAPTFWQAQAFVTVLEQPCEDEQVYNAVKAARNGKKLDPVFQRDDKAAVGHPNGNGRAP